MNISHRKKFLFECSFLAFIFALLYHFVNERICFRILPTGDEGSWMGVAAEFCKGHGFITKWLEFLYLEHWPLPRPDDYRYPGLVVILAASFKCFGISYATGLWTVAGIFFAFCFSLYFSVRKLFGRKTAIITLSITIASLLQLHWNTQVYSEGLFGLVLSLLILITLSIQPQNRSYWILSGLLIGILYLVRVNAILFVPSMIFAAMWFAYYKKISVKISGYALVSFLLVASPWLLRMWLEFGNMFHFAATAGLLRTSVTELPTQGLGKFITLNGVLFPLKATIIGCKNLMISWNFFEHGLQYIPLAFAFIALIRRKPFYSPLIRIGFGITFLACCYVAYLGSWASLRYFSSFIPFIYAYGIHEALQICETVATKFIPKLKFLLTPLILCLCLLPVFYPHKYYERIFSGNKPNQNVQVDYIQTISSLVDTQEYYCARSLAQLNFLCNRKCIGIQDFFDSSKVDTVVARFKPVLLVITSQEESTPVMQQIMKKFNANYGSLFLTKETNLAKFYRMRYDSLPKPSALHEIK